MENRQHQWKVRLSDDEKAQADLLVSISGQRSRERWFSGVLAALAARQVQHIDHAVAAFRIAVGSASDDAAARTRNGDAGGAAEAGRAVDAYRAEIVKYEAERLILSQTGAGAGGGDGDGDGAIAAQEMAVEQAVEHHPEPSTADDAREREPARTDGP